MVYKMVLEVAAFSLLLISSASLLAGNAEYNLDSTDKVTVLSNKTQFIRETHDFFSEPVNVIEDSNSIITNQNNLVLAQTFVAETNPWLLPERAPKPKSFNRYSNYSKPQPEAYQSNRYSPDVYKPEDFMPGKNSAKQYEPNGYELNNTVPRNIYSNDYGRQPQQPKSQPQPQKIKPYQSGRFVTPEILESLKHQQMYFQSAPGYQNYQQQRYQQQPRNMIERGRRTVMPRVPAMPRSSYSAPSYGLESGGLVPGSLAPSYLAPGNLAPGNMGNGLGMGWGRAADTNNLYNNSKNLLGDGYSGGASISDPLYDVPMVSPWGNGPDVLYRGESLPGSIPGSFADTFTGSYPGISGVPSEAFGGLPPIEIQSYEYDGSDFQKPDLDDYNPANPDSYIRDNVFNPRNFMPGSNLQ